MRRALLILAAVALVLAAFLFLRPDPDPDVSIERGREPPSAELQPEVPPVEGAPCQLAGLIHEGTATRVRVQSQRARIDVDARLLRAGRAYSAQVPEQGSLHIVAVADDGRTIARRAVCSGEGTLQVDLHFPPKDPRAATLEGRCTYLDTGAPVPEAVVRGSLARSFGRTGDLVWSGLTDEEGRFLLSVPPGGFAVQCGKDGDDSDPVRVHLVPQARQSLELFVEARAAVAGIVVAASGEPIAGVAVIARNAGGREDERSLSDDEGRFVIRNLRPGAVVVEAHHRGEFAEAQALARVELPYPEVRLQLEESPLGITGVVRGDDGPIAGALVETIPNNRRGIRTPLKRSTITDKEGRYTLGGLVGGFYAVTARASGYTAAEVELEVRSGLVQAVLTLQRACTSRLRVLPAEPKRPVVVSVEPKEGGSREVSGETGQPLEVSGASGRATVSVRTVGTAVRTATISAELCGPEIVVSLPSDRDTGVIEVLVRDRERAPVSGVRVALERHQAGETGADGKVRFEGLAPGEYWIGARDVEPVRVEVEPNLTVFTELLIGRESGRISGTVLAERSPAEGARVVASCSDSGWDRGAGGGSVVARSDAEGAFSFEPKNGSVCTVRAEHERFGRSQPATLRTNGPPAELELLASGSISGQVTQAGAAVVRYAVTVRSLGRASESETRTIYVSDPSGRYRVDDVMPGRVSVTIVAESGRAHREVELARGQHERVDLAIFDLGEVRGRVIAGGKPVFGAHVMVRALGEARARLRTDADGRFAAKVPSGEPLRVFVRADGHYPWGSLPFDLSPEEPADLGDVILKPRGGAEEKEGGLGIMFAGDPRGIRVIRFTDDSPAREAGMDVGDLITAIDGVPAGREPLVNWVVNLRGLAGTPVVLEVERGTMPPFTITVIRRSIGLDPVP